ncbi:HTH_Tnp_Tc3_2 domain-containing protein [Trichonephila clavipes]|uniref:HTH_Tnp_Tc3_2 domain-containing protein n=1 Tax=Trichonephila clavipes TaxID=2585209 RepID=A0A8X6V9N7_TRICX|nr:HTH_Tnp_Tc3_2 domain-containing protein [Trichonephila clavipes]
MPLSRMENTTFAMPSIIDSHDMGLRTVYSPDAQKKTPIQLYLKLFRLLLLSFEVGKRKVLKDVKIDPKLSAVKLATETSRIMGRSVSAETARNVVRHAGYSSRVARKKPFISLQNQKKRLEFAKTHQLKTDNFWKKVIFNDESNFNIFGSDGRHTV